MALNALVAAKSQIAQEIESVEGTKETLVAADAFLAKDIVFKPNQTPNERLVAVSDMSGFKPVPGDRNATLSFKVGVKGSGTIDSPPEYGDLFKACGMSETINASTNVIYAPISTGGSTITLGFYIDGQAYKMWGARGTVKLVGEIGQIANWEFEFTGADWEKVTEALLTSPSYDATTPLVFQNATFTLDSFAFFISKLEVDLGNTLTLNPDVNSSSGFKSAIVTARRAVGSFDPNDVLIASYDLLGKLKSGAEGALSIVLGGTAGNIFTITAPKVSYGEATPGVRDGIAISDVGLFLNRSSGNDELVFTQT